MLYCRAHLLQMTASLSCLIYIAERIYYIWLRHYHACCWYTTSTGQDNNPNYRKGSKRQVGIFMCKRWDLNPWPHDYNLTVHPTELPRQWIVAVGLFTSITVHSMMILSMPVSCIAQCYVWLRQCHACTLSLYHDKGATQQSLCKDDSKKLIVTTQSAQGGTWTHDRKVKT